MNNNKSVFTALATHFKLLAKSCLTFEEEMVKMSYVSYSSAVDNIIYVMVCIRPDLSYAVSVLSRYMHNPRTTRKRGISRPYFAFI